VQELIVVPETTRIRVGLEPVYNAFLSLGLLYKTGHLSGLDEWVTRTAAALTPAERQANEMVFIGLHFAVRPDGEWPSFPAYLDHLASVDPEVLRDKLLQMYARVRHEEGVTCPMMADEPVPVDFDAVLDTPEAYVRFLIERFGLEGVDPELERRAYALVVDPPAMQARIVSHLRAMWETHLAPEWARVRPMLEDAVQAFQEFDMAGVSDLDAARQITGQELDADKWGPVLKGARQIVFVPSAHVGPYVFQLCSSDTLHILFGARLPDGATYSAPDLSRAEILVRLNALSDGNRLRILKLVSERGEQSSLDLIAALQLSQSTVSRHLKQLTATGYLAERRCNGAKCYTLNPERIDATLRALSAYLLGR
jgi:ArsR family transcriptional regulator